MQTSILIARLLGPMLAVIGLAMLIDPERARRLAREFLDGEALLFLSGLLTLISGLAIVNTHHVWSGWPVVITLLGWLMVLAGIVRLLLPGRAKAIGAAMIDRTAFLRVPSAFLAAVGAYLAGRGYFG